ncbi:MAG: hypothetical protein U0414_15970 [Polyangiaceae bacterium]
MKALPTTVLGLALLVPLATGCAGRQAPFNDLDNAQVTILKLQGQPQPSVLPTPGGTGGLPFNIPGLTPEQQAQIQAGIGGIGAAVQTVIPGLPIPGMPGATTPVTQPQQTFNGFVVQGSSPVADENLKDELLDIFGKSDSFNQSAGQCFTPGMGVVFSDPAKGNVELMVSFSCNAVKGNGFSWPHANFGMTPETSGKLRQIYTQMFMQPPPNPGG